MRKVLSYSLTLIVGILFSQTIDLTFFRPLMTPLSFIFLGYIMIQVGLEFTLDKKKLKSYGKDYLIAMTAAAFPWILCSFYFWNYFDLDLSKAIIIGRFAAPTSAGVLFTMLIAAGLASTWVFKKARILAIFDDLDTILLIVPLQMIHLGINWNSLAMLFVIILLLILSYFYLHRLHWPASNPWLLLYAIGLTLICEFLEKNLLINLEILLPAFVFGCILVNPHLKKEKAAHLLSQKEITSKKERWKRFDDTVKLTYMFLVGCSLPPIQFEKTPWLILAFHVLIITCLANIGKLYPMLCYKREASFRERVALSIAMWPRGEVGAGILILSMNYAISPIVLELAGLSLALNIALTGLFIYIVQMLLKTPVMKRAE